MMTLMREQKNLFGIGFMLIVGVGVILCACSSSPNLLTTVPPKRAAQFLVHASQVAEKKLGHFRPPGGYVYGECMNSKENKTLCKHLYQAMVDYAKSTAHFKRLTLKDLTDPKVFQALEDEYSREQFNTV